MKQLHTVDEVIDAFGGHKRAADNNKAVAEWLGLGVSAVCNWRERNSIPSGWHLRFYREARRLRVEIADQVFGVTGAIGAVPPVLQRSAKKKPSARPETRVA